MRKSEIEGDVAVVVTHYRKPEDLQRCLEAIATHGGPRVAEVWVADSEAGPDTRSLIHSVMPNARHLPFRRNVGFAALVNMGSAASTTPYVMVLNADVQIATGTIETLIEHLDSEPQTGVAFPQLRYPNNALQYSAFAFYRPLTIFYRRTPLGRLPAGQRELRRFLDVEELERSVATGNPVDVDWALGAAMMIKRRTLLEVGPLDENYFLYFEDVDWCLRVWEAGWRCRYVPTAVCSHDYGRGSAGSGILGLVTNRLVRYHIRSAIRFFAKHGRHVQRAAVPEQHQLIALRTGPARSADAQPEANASLISGHTA